MKKVCTIICLFSLLFCSCEKKEELNIKVKSNVVVKEPTVKVGEIKATPTEPNPVIEEVKEELPPRLKEEELNFGEKNGKLISFSENDTSYIVHRSFNLPEDSWYFSKRGVYSSFNAEEKYGEINSGDLYTVSEILYVEPKKENVDKYTVWAKINISEKDLTGWISFGRYNKTSLPYTIDSYTFNKTLTNGSYNWTIRNLNGNATTYKEVLELRDLPGFNNTNIIEKVVCATTDENGKTHYKTPEITFTMITEEKETDENSEIGTTEPWVYGKVDGKEGWIYGGDLDFARGGVRFESAEDTFIFTCITSKLV